MTFTKPGTLLTAALLLLLNTAAQAQESSAVTNFTTGAQNLGIETRVIELSSLTNTLVTELQQLQVEVDDLEEEVANLETCQEQNKFYVPTDATANAQGCIFGNTTALLVTGGSNKTCSAIRNNACTVSESIYTLFPNQSRASVDSMQEIVVNVQTWLNTPNLSFNPEASTSDSFTSVGGKGEEGIISYNSANIQQLAMVGEITLRMGK